MAQEPRYTSHDDRFEARYTSSDDQFQFAEPADLDEFGSQPRSYHSTRSVATRETYLPEEPVPLFLSGYDEAPGPLGSRNARGRAGTSRRLIKTGILAVAATVAAFAALSARNPFTVFANATASLIGTSDVRSAPAPAAPAVQPTTTARTSSPPAAPPTAVARASSPPANQAPSRDEIALALKAAHQNLAPVETVQPAAAVAAIAPAAIAPAAVAPAAIAPVAIPAPPARKLAADELATLMTRAKGLLAAGDIPPARLLLERAADAQEPSAALMLAQTYDPAVLGTQDIRNITPDPALARTWYQRAAQLGSADAQRRLSQLQ
jgi:hypothetical protein